MQAWYAKTFGGVIGKRESVARPGNFIDCDDVPGANLSIGASETLRQDRQEISSPQIHLAVTVILA